MDESKSTKYREESREAWLERLRDEPDVIIRQGSGKPFVSGLRVKKGTDILRLLGRRDEEWSDEIDQDRRAFMAQRKPHEHTIEADEDAEDRILSDPRVIVHEQKTTEPFVSQLRVTPGLDILELIGRRGDDDEEADESDCR